MRVLEDLGFYCVDNLPVALAPNVAMLAAGRDPACRASRSEWIRASGCSFRSGPGYSRNSTRTEFILK